MRPARRAATARTSVTELDGLGFVDLSIVCRERMDAVLVARKA